MNTHPYLRAYMAGIVAPSVGLLIALTAFILTRLVFQVPIPIERVIIFPMALVPNLFGIWNIIYLWSGRRSGQESGRRYLPIGFHGALLPLIMVPIGVLGATCIGFMTIGSRGVTWFQAISVPYRLIVPCFFFAVIVYYLVWKYIVGFLNRVLGIA